MSSPLNERKRKFSTIVVIMCLLFTSVFSMILVGNVNAPSPPQYKGGNMIVTGGKTVVIKDSDPFRHSGDIIINAASTLIIKNSTFKINPDISHPYTITVTQNSNLIIEDSIFTVDTSAIQATYFLKFEIIDSTIEILNSSMIFPGTLYVNNSNFRAVNSLIEELSLGYGSPIQSFNSSYVYYEDCLVDDFKVNNPIRLLADTEFIAINTFFDLDYNKIQMTVANSSHAELYGITINTGLYQFRPINIIHPPCWVNIYRWLEVNVIDRLEVPIAGARIEVKNTTNYYSPDPPKYILDYLGKNIGNYNQTNSSGKVKLGLLSDNLTYDSMPNALFKGNYKLTAHKTSLTCSKQVGLPAYPILTKITNNPNATLQFNDIISPLNNNYYTKTKSDIIITDGKGTILNSKYQKPQGGVVDLSFGQQGNIIVNGTSPGGMLNISKSNIGIEQDQTHKYFVLLEENGVINFEKLAGIKDGIVTPGKYPINIYLQDYSKLILNKQSILKNIGAFCLESNSQLIVKNSELNARKLYAKGVNQNLKLDFSDNSILNLTSMSVRNAELDFKKTNISIKSEPVLENIIMDASDTYFNQDLTFKKNSIATLINVTGTEFKNISAEDTSTVDVYWWLTVVVEDEQGNKLENAEVIIENYTMENNNLVRKTYKQGFTNEKGKFIVDVLGGRITSAGHYYGGLIGNYHISATYHGSSSDTGGSSRGGTRQSHGNIDVFGENQEVIIIIPGTPDLTVGDITYDGGYKNYNTTISANIQNIGDFAAFNVNVELWDTNLNKKLGEQKIGYLNSTGAPDSTETISVVHKYTLEGEYDIRVIVDPTNTIKEKSESNNDKIQRIKIKSLDKADLIVVPGSLYTKPQTPIPINSIIEVGVEIKNIGTITAQNFNVRFMAYDINKKIEFALGEDQTISLSPGKSDKIIADYPWLVTNLTQYNVSVYIDIEDIIDEYSEDNNFGWKTIDIVQGPDLKIDSISFYPKPPITRENGFDIIATISNVGESDSTEFSVGFYLDSKDVLIQKKSSQNGLRLGNSTSVILSITDAQAKQMFSEARTYTIYVEVDPDNEIAETDESSESNEQFVELEMKLKQDLEITEDYITFSANPAGNGEQFDIYAQIRNIGKTKAQSYTVRFFLGEPGKSGSRQIGTDKISNGLGAGQTQTFELKWTLTQGGAHHIWVVIVTEQDEEDKKNNRASNKLYVNYKPDLFVKEIISEADETGEQPLINRPINLTYIIGNAGDTTAYVFTIEVWDGSPGSTASKQLVNKTEAFILFGKENKYQYVYTPRTPGVHNIWIIVDAMNQINEENEANNTKSISISVARTAPDLKINNNEIEILVKREINGNTTKLKGVTVFQVQEEFWVEFEIKNRGEDIAFNFSVNIYLDNKETLIHSERINDLHFLDNWDADLRTGFNNTHLIKSNKYLVKKNMVDGLHHIEIVIDPENNINDSNLDNNKLTSYNFTVVEPNIEYTGVLVENQERERIYDDGPVGKVKMDEGIIITATVENKGSDIATEVYLNVYVNGELFGSSSQILKLDTETDKKTNKSSVGTLEYIIPQHNQESDFNLLLEIVAIYGDPDTIEDHITFYREYNVPIQIEKAESKEKEETPLSIGLFPYDIIVILIIIIIICVVVGLVIFMKKKREKMAECSECGALIPIDATECPKCGAEFSDEIECGECGALMKVTDTTCPVCGAVFTKEAEAEAKEGEVELTGGLGGPGLGTTPGAKPSVPAPAPTIPTKPTPSKPAPGKPRAPATVKPSPPAVRPKPAPIAAPTPPLAAEQMEEAEEEGEEEKAECYRCGAIVPLSASMCPECGAEFE